MKCDSCYKPATMNVTIEIGHIIPNSHGNREVEGWETKDYCDWHGPRAYKAARLGLGYGILSVARMRLPFV